MVAIKLITAGITFTTTVAVSVKAVLQPLIVISLNIITVLVVTPATITTPFPIASNTIVVAPPPSIVYVTVAFGVPTKLKTAFVPEQTGDVAIRDAKVAPDVLLNVISSGEHPVVLVSILV